MIKSFAKTDSEKPPDSILIIGPAWIGDMVMAQTLFMLIKQRNPAATIDVLAPPWSHELLQRMPEVRHTIISPFQHKEMRLLERYQLAKTLRHRGYQQAIVLPNSFKSALIPFWAKIPRRTGWIKEPRWILLNDPRYLDKEKLPLMFQRFMALGLAKGSEQKIPQPLPQPRLAIQTESIKATAEKFGVFVPKDLNFYSSHQQTANLQDQASHKSILALCPGAEFGPTKRWPAEYYAKVAKEMIQAGWEVWLFGSTKDRIIAEEIISACHQHPHCINLAGRTTLGEAIDLLSAARIIISNDSGLMHVGAALNKPIIALYGSTTAQFTPPLSKLARTLSLELDCQPCFKRTCPLGHFKCMNDLLPTQVMEAIHELLATPL